MTPDQQGIARQYTFTAVNTTATEVLGPNPRRRGLIIFPPTTETVFVSFGETASATVGGVYPVTMSHPMRYCSKMGDQFIKGSVHAFSAAGTGVIRILEINEFIMGDKGYGQNETV